MLTNLGMLWVNPLGDRKKAVHTVMGKKQYTLSASGAAGTDEFSVCAVYV